MIFQLFLLVAFFVAGIVAKYLPVFRGFHHHLNRFIIWICLPALALVHVPKIHLTTDLWMPVATAWIVFAGSVVFFMGLGWWCRFNRSTTACLILTCGLLNSAFIGLPVVEMLYGKSALPIAILVDQPGSFLVLSTAGTVVAVVFSSGNFSLRKVFLSIVAFPPLWGFALALVLRWHQLTLPFPIAEALHFLAAMLTPLALILVGMQLELERKILCDKTLFIGLVFKLILAPLLIFILYAMVLENRSLNMQVSVMQSAMAPMISGGILATTFGLNPQLASRVIGLGIPLSVFTLTFWFLLLKSIV